MFDNELDKIKEAYSGSYDIIDIVGDADCTLVTPGCHIENPLFRMNRASISTGIFESKIAQLANTTMSNGNLYKLTQIHSSNPIYIEAKDLELLIGFEIK